MKKIVIVCMALTFVLTHASYAQKIQDSTSKNEIKYSKEEKAAFKAKQEADLTAALTAAGLNDSEMKSVRDIMAEAAKKGAELKNNTTLSPEEKDTAKKGINDDKNNKLKVLMGEDRFKKYSATRKKQKEAAMQKAE